jgi:hypothetical protein
VAYFLFPQTHSRFNPNLPLKGLQELHPKELSVQLFLQASRGQATGHRLLPAHLKSTRSGLGTEEPTKGSEHTLKV